MSEQARGASPVATIGRHQASGRTGLGLALASCTMLMWGGLPLALEVLLETIDPITLIWFRFFVSALGLGAILAAQGRLPRLDLLDRGGWILLLVATGFLAGNYFGYLLGLDRTNAASAQVLIQLAPLLLAVGGIFVFRERFARLQWIGLGVLLIGLLGFFGAQITALVAEIDRYLSGVALIGFAAVTWAIYGLAQKQLLTRLGSQGIMLCIYVGSAGIFWLGARTEALGGLGAAGWVVMAFASGNTLVAYGTFAAALEHWEASRVSAVLALTPIATLLFTQVAVRIWPEHVSTEGVTPGAVVAACIVVAGSMLVALGGNRVKRVPAAGRRPTGPDKETRPATDENLRRSP